MNDQQMRQYQARMAVAQAFCSFLNTGSERTRLLERLGVEAMPTIIPALGDTLASDIREAASRRFEEGAAHVVVPVSVQGQANMRLGVIVVSREAEQPWQLELEVLPDGVEMAQVVEALDSSRKREVETFNSLLQQELNAAKL